MSDSGELHTRSRDFAKIPAALLHDKRISPGAVRLYGHMHWRYGSNHKNWEGRQSMATYLGVSMTTISKWVKELEAYSWVVVVERDYNEKTGNYQTPFYHVFETKRSASQFRRNYKPVETEKLRPLPRVKARKSRAGIGGKPSHRTPEKADPVNSSLHGENGVHPVNSSLRGAVNSSLRKPEAVDLDSKRVERPRFTLALYQGQDTYADGHFIDTLKPDFIDACNALFWSWLDALDAAGRKPDTTPRDLWAKYKDAIKALAMNRRTPEQVAAFVAYVYAPNSPDDFWRKNLNPVNPAAISNTLAAWLQQEAQRAAPETAFVSPLPPARQLTEAEIAARLAAKEAILKGEADGE